MSNENIEALAKRCGSGHIGQLIYQLDKSGLLKKHPDDKSRKLEEEYGHVTVYRDYSVRFGSSYVKAKEVEGVETNERESYYEHIEGALYRHKKTDALYIGLEVVNTKRSIHFVDGYQVEGDELASVLEYKSRSKPRPDNGRVSNFRHFKLDNVVQLNAEGEKAYQGAKD